MRLYIVALYIQRKIQYHQIPGKYKLQYKDAGASQQSRSGPENVHGGAKKETKARDYKDGVERFRHVTTKGRSLTPTLFNISYLYRKA